MRRLVFCQRISKICSDGVFVSSATRTLSETKNNAKTPGTNPEYWCSLAVVVPCHTCTLQNYSPPSFNERQGQPMKRKTNKVKSGATHSAPQCLVKNVLNEHRGGKRNVFPIFVYPTLCGIAFLKTWLGHERKARCSLLLQRLSKPTRCDHDAGSLSTRLVV